MKNLIVSVVGGAVGVGRGGFDAVYRARQYRFLAVTGAVWAIPASGK